MRLSADRLDPAFNRELLPAECYLDDVKLTEVVTADEEEGWAVVYVLNDAGSHIFESHDKLLTRTLHGVVRIVPKPK